MSRPTPKGFVTQDGIGRQFYVQMNFQDKTDSSKISSRIYVYMSPPEIVLVNIYIYLSRLLLFTPPPSSFSVYFLDSSSYFIHQTFFFHILTRTSQHKWIGMGSRRNQDKVIQNRDGTKKNSRRPGTGLKNFFCFPNRTGTIQFPTHPDPCPPLIVTLS